jgi:hypothetical protein
MTNVIVDELPDGTSRQRTVEVFTDVDPANPKLQLWMYRLENGIELKLVNGEGEVELQGFLTTDDLIELID